MGFFPWFSHGFGELSIQNSPPHWGDPAVAAMVSSHDSPVCSAPATRGDWGCWGWPHGDGPGEHVPFNPWWEKHEHRWTPIHVAASVPTISEKVRNHNFREPTQGSREILSSKNLKNSAAPLLQSCSFWWFLKIPGTLQLWPFISYITGYFNGLIHSINGVISTYNW